MAKNTHYIPETISEEEELLDILTQNGEAELWQLEEAGVKRRFSTGKDAWGDQGWVIIDANDRHWDYVPSEGIYRLSDNMDSPYLTLL